MQIGPALPAEWIRILNRLDFAFQPLVSSQDGHCYGYEALLRGTEAAGFNLIAGVFDQAHNDGVLLPLELALWTRAIGKFARLPHAVGRKLLCNADNRGVLTRPEYRAELVRILEGFGLTANTLGLEISEYQHFDPSLLPSGDGILHALDDFGTDYADLNRLQGCPSDIVKIDRYFISNIDTNLGHRVMVKAATALAQQLGRLVVAEGVETEAEMLICRLIGCDYLQGYYFQKPTLNVSELRASYDLVPAPCEAVTTTTAA